MKKRAQKMHRSTMMNRVRTFVMRESFIIAACAILLWSFLTYVTYFRSASQNADTTFVAQVLHNFKSSPSMQTTYYTSTSELIDHIWYHRSAEVCAMDLESQYPDTPWGHYYAVAYLLYPFIYVFDIQFLLALLQASIYTSALVFAYVLARKKHVDVWPSLVFTFLVSQHPLWEMGLQGQFYFNRFFIPSAALLILLLEKERKNIWLILLASVVAASTNEINGIFVFFILTTYMWIRKKIDFKLLAIGVVFVCVSVISVVLIQQNYPLVSTQQGVFGSTFGGGVSHMVKLVHDNLANPKTATFVAVNLASIGFVALFDAWAVLPLLLFVMPNLFLGVGGGEKTGWETHYHTGYFIPLIWLSVYGLKRLNTRKTLQLVVLASCMVFTMVVEPYTLGVNREPRIPLKNTITYARYYLSHWKPELEFKKNIRAAVGDGTTVSAPGEVAYQLYDHRMYYYPMGIDSVDVVLLQVDESKQGKKRFYSTNYGQQDKELDACILDRMEKNGFDLEHPQTVSGWAIFKRK